MASAIGLKVQSDHASGSAIWRIFQWRLKNFSLKSQAVDVVVVSEMDNFFLANERLAD